MLQNYGSACGTRGTRGAQTHGVQKVGSYALGDTIGEGTFAIVRFGTHMSNGERVAIKCVPKRKIAKMNMGRQIRNEISIMKMIQHKNVVRLKEVLMSSSTVYLVMELVRGGELYDLIAKGRMSMENARRYFRELMLGVAYCHEQNTCHRDLKPENLLIDEHGTLKIADFGFAALVEFEPERERERVSSGASNASNASSNGAYRSPPRKRLEAKEEIVKFDDYVAEPAAQNTELDARIARRMSTVCGTCAYIAPEVLTHEGYDGRLADVWSCGVIAFVLCSGFLPFDDREDDHKKLFEKIQNAQITYPPWLTPEQVDILSHLLERDPRRRWTAAQVLKHPWLSPKEEDPQTEDKFEKFMDPSSGNVIFSGKSVHGPSKVIEDTRLALLRIGWDARAYPTTSATVLRATRLSSAGTLGLSVDIDVPVPRSVSEGESTRIVVHRRLGDFTKDRNIFAQLVDSLANVLT